MLFDQTYSDALRNIEHLKALGLTTVYLRDGGELPWKLALRADAGGTWRLSGPSSCYIIAEQDGLTFKWNVEFEERDANGRGVSLFSRDRLREVALKLPEQARASFADLLAKQVLPEMEKRSAEIRAALNNQLDSEDCVRGLIVFAQAVTKAEPA